MPHVHIHILPRNTHDYDRNDQVYDELEKSDMSRNLKVDAEKEREPRTSQQMAAEAKILRKLYDSPVPIPADSLLQAVDG